MRSNPFIFFPLILDSPSLFFGFRGVLTRKCVVVIVPGTLPQLRSAQPGLESTADRRGGWSPCFPLANAVCLLRSPFLQKEEYHTRLALLYLDEVLRQGPSTGGRGAEVTETQAKLRQLLQKSDLYRVHFLMGEEDLSVSPLIPSRGRDGEGSAQLFVLSP